MSSAGLHLYFTKPENLYTELSTSFQRINLNDFGSGCNGYRWYVGGHAAVKYYVWCLVFTLHSLNTAMRHSSFYVFNFDSENWGLFHSLVY